MANNKNPNEKQPGENPEGKFHFNPGNMAGKKPGDPEQTAENRDADQERSLRRCSNWEPDSHKKVRRCSENC